MREREGKGGGEDNCDVCSSHDCENNVIDISQFRYNYISCCS